MAKDALVLMDHLCWSRCHVVGVSMGGMIALELALLAPRRILSLTLMATHAGGLIGQAPLIGIRLIFRSMVLGDERQLVSNALNMLYGPKTLNDPDRRKVNCYSQRFFCWTQNCSSSSSTITLSGSRLGFHWPWSVFSVRCSPSSDTTSATPSCWKFAIPTFPVWSWSVLKIGWYAKRIRTCSSE